MDKELNEPYNTTIIRRKNTQNRILNIRRIIVKLKGDKWASNLLVREEDNHCLEKNVHVPGSMIIMPDSGTLQENKHGYLPQPSILSPVSTITTIVPGLNSYYLLSLWHLCVDGWNVILNKQKMYATNKKEVMIEGERNFLQWPVGHYSTIKSQIKTSIQTNNHTTTTSHESYYTKTLKYKSKQSLYINSQRPS